MAILTSDSEALEQAMGLPAGTSEWSVDEGLDGVTLTNYEHLTVSRPQPTTEAEEAVWNWLRATGQTIPYAGSENDGG